MNIRPTTLLCALSAAGFTTLLVGCKNKPGAPPPPTVDSVSNVFTMKFTTLASGSIGRVDYSATENLSDKTTRPGAGLATKFEVFPNSQGAINNFGNVMVSAPTYVAATDKAGAITDIGIKCDNPNQPVQVHATDVGTKAEIKFEFACK